MTPDRAAKETDKILSQLERYLRKMYKQVDKEIREEIEPFLNEIYLDDEDAGPNKRLQHAKKADMDVMIALVVSYILPANERAVGRINDAMNVVAGTNYEYVRDVVVSKTGKGIGGTAAAYSGTKYSKRSFNWLQQQQYVSDEILKELKKGIRLGESIPKLAERVQKVSNRNRNNATLVARTESTRIQNLSRLDAMNEAQKMGVEFDKQWVATLDDRTREWHADMDGETVGPNDLFSNGMEYPGDPAGGPEQVCNCRCTMTMILKE